MRFTGNGITSCYPDEVDNFISITVLRSSPPRKPLRRYFFTGSAARSHAPREAAGGSRCCAETVASTWAKLITGTVTLSRASWSTPVWRGREVDGPFGRGTPRMRGVRGGSHGWWHHARNSWRRASARAWSSPIPCAIRGRIASDYGGRLMLALHRTVDPEPCDGSGHHQTGGATGVLCQSEGEEMPQAVGSWRRVAAGLRCSPRVADTDAGIVGWVDTGVQRPDGSESGASRHFCAASSCALASRRDAQYLRIRSATALRCSSLIARFRLRTTLAAFFVPRPRPAARSPRAPR